MRACRHLRTVATVLLILAALCWPAQALAGPGELDSSFGAGGVFVFDQRNTRGADLVVQSDDRIVVVGTAAGHMTVYRLSADGALDAAFGSQGAVSLAGFGSEADEIDEGYGLALQPDGKIVVVGRTQTKTSVLGDMAVARLNTDGSLDAGFDGDGRAVVDFGGMNDWAYAAAVQSDGKIVVAGLVRQNIDDHFGVVRLNADGSLDTTFDGDGRAVYDFVADPQAIGADEAKAVALQTDGKIILAGTTGAQASSVSYEDFCVARINADGSLDTSFGGVGYVRVDFAGGQDRGTALEQQPDGKIVIGGQTVGSTVANFALARITPTGALDAAFGSGGRATVDFPGVTSESLNDLVLLSDGRLVAVGSAYNAFSPGTELNGDVGLAGLTPAGVLDSSFGAGGLVTTDIFGFLDWGQAAALQSSGKIVVAGSVRRSLDNSGDDDSLFVARYQDLPGPAGALYLPLVRNSPAPAFPLRNGDFEAGHTGWTEYSKQALPIIVATYQPLPVKAHSGVWGAWLAGTADEISSLQQTVEIPADQTELRYWYYILSEDSCGHDYAGVVIDGAVVDRYDLCAADNTGGWQLHRVDLSRYGGQVVQLQLRAETNAAGISHLFVDDVTFAAPGE